MKKLLKNFEVWVCQQLKDCCSNICLYDARKRDLGQKQPPQQTVNLWHIPAIHVFTVLKLTEKDFFGQVSKYKFFVSPALNCPVSEQ